MYRNSISYFYAGENSFYVLDFIYSHTRTCEPIFHESIGSRITVKGNTKPRNKRWSHSKCCNFKENAIFIHYDTFKYPHLVKRFIKPLEKISPQYSNVTKLFLKIDRISLTHRTNEYCSPRRPENFLPRICKYPRPAPVNFEWSTPSEPRTPISRSPVRRTAGSILSLLDEPIK